MADEGNPFDVDDGTTHPPVAGPDRRNGPRPPNTAGWDGVAGVGSSPSTPTTPPHDPTAASSAAATAAPSASHAIDSQERDGSPAAAYSLHHSTATLAASTAAARRGRVMELIDDADAGPPPPLGILEAGLIANNEDEREPKERSGKMEHIDDGVGPDNLADIEATTAGRAEKMATAAAAAETSHAEGNVELIEDDDHPVSPFVLREVGDGDWTMKKGGNEYGEGKAAKKASIRPSSAEVGASTCQDDDDFDDLEDPPGSARLEGGSRAAASPGGTEIVGHPPIALDEEEGGSTGNNSNGADDNGSTIEAGVEVGVPTTNNGMPQLEAYLVEEQDEGELVVASPLGPVLPWYKQRRARCFLGVGTVLLAGLAIGLGISLTDEPSSTVTVMSTKPTDQPTSSPSTSLKPSTSPTACINKIISGAQQIDLPLDDPQEPKVAINGRNMVVVAREGDKDARGAVFITFYTRKNGEWQGAYKNTFREIGLGSDYSVAMSGKSALVGFPLANDDAGTALVFEQDGFGGWQKVDDRLVRDTNATDNWFGYHVDIDGDLACVTDRNNAHLFLRVTSWFSGPLFRREGYKWIQFNKIEDGWLCSISGDTIAIWDPWDDVLKGDVLRLYKYDRDLDEVVPIQDPIPTGWWGVSLMDLSNNYLIYWHSYEGDAFVYRRDPTNQTFSPLQQFNVTNPEYNFGLALDNDILVIGGNASTHIFSEQDGSWIESMTLDQPYYRYALSGRTLVAATVREVHSFNIEDCAQAMPTQTPSLSIAPSDIPTALRA